MANRKSTFTPKIMVETVPNPSPIPGRDLSEAFMIALKAVERMEFCVSSRN